jgi:hypothetical protein
MRSGRIQNPIASAREWENAATERQNRIAGVALPRMMVFHSALWQRHNTHGARKIFLPTRPLRQSALHFSRIDGKRLFSP